VRALGDAAASESDERAVAVVEREVGEVGSLLHARRLVPPAVDAEPWAPPPREPIVDIEEAVGSPVDGLLPDEESEFAEPAFASVRERELVRGYPPRIRAAFRGVRSARLRSKLVRLVEDELLRRAKAAGCVREMAVPGEVSKRYVPGIHRRRLLGRLASDGASVARLRNVASRDKRACHLVALFGSPSALPVDLPDCRPPSRGGKWRADSWLGLASSSMVESAPEGVLVGVAQRFWRSWRSRRPPVVLNWGAGPSTFALALMATAPRGMTAHIVEVDTVGQPQGIPWVKYRAARVPDAPRSYDLILAHVPPPALGANHVRNSYKDVPHAAAHESQTHASDIGRLGPRKWCERAARLVRQVAALARPGAEVVMLLPLAVRTTARAGESARVEWRYEPAPEHADRVVAALKACGMAVILDLAVEELNPVPQPFFAARRCPWRCVVARPRRADAEREAVAEFLEGLEAELVQ
jgi:hypothetical protein